MDIALFSEMVKNLILDNDEVTLPGVGSFVSEMVPSTFSDKGYTINPPYRRLSFRQRSGHDNALVEMYAEANRTDLDSARRIMEGFLSELLETLKTRKTVALPGLGRLRATRENTFFFIPDEDLDIYQYGFGLSPVSLKTHEETPEEVSEAVATLKDIVDSVPAPVSESTPVEDEAKPEEPVKPEEPARVEEPVQAEIPAAVEQSQAAPVLEPKRGKRPLRIALISILAVLLAACIFLGGFILLAHVAPDFIDSLLYTQDELNIINHK